MPCRFVSTKVRKLFESAIALEELFSNDLFRLFFCQDFRLDVRCLELRRVTDAKVSDELTITLDILLGEIV